MDILKEPDLVKLLGVAIHSQTQNKSLEPNHYFCELCGKSFNELSTFKDHCELKHRKENQCEVCKKVFYWPSKLKAHSNFGKSYIIKCHLCGKVFVQAFEKDGHMKICDKGLIMNTANKELAIRCRKCSKHFSASDDLVMHHIKDHSVRN